MKRIVTIQFDANEIRRELKRQGITAQNETFGNGAGWTEVVLSHLENKTPLVDLIFNKVKPRKTGKVKR